MKASGISEIKQELDNVGPAKLAALCLRLAKFKKENKELLTYLLFEEHDMAGYLEKAKAAMQEQFTEINTSAVYFVKKSLRKILRGVNTTIRYTGSKQAEAELLICFCYALKDSGIAFRKNTILNNIYLAQLEKIRKAVSTMHEDLQYDYNKDILDLRE